MSDIVVWLTYDEAALRLGIKPDSVRRRSSAKKWPRRVGNDGLARVGLPPDLLPETINEIPPVVPPDESGGTATKLAAAQAMITGLEARLTDTQADRDHWRDLAERLVSKEQPASIWLRLFKR